MCMVHEYTYIVHVCICTCVWYSCLVQCNRSQGLIWARIVHAAFRLRRGATPNRKNQSNPAYRIIMCIILKGREHFSWGRRSHSYRCQLVSLVVATCVETIADAEQQLNKTVVSSRLLLGVEFSFQLTMFGAR